MSFYTIAAIARGGVIGQGGGLPWPRLTGDLYWFKALTRARYPESVARFLIGNPDLTLKKGGGFKAEEAENAVILGRRTWESLKNPLSHRENIVITTTYDPSEISSWRAYSFGNALTCAKWLKSHSIFVIGGAQIYSEALRHPGCEGLFLTEVDAEYPEADTWWPVCSGEINWENGIMGTDCGEDVPTFFPDGPWQRTAVSAWITEPERPLYRFGKWERV